MQYVDCKSFIIAASRWPRFRLDRLVLRASQGEEARLQEGMTVELFGP